MDCSLIQYTLNGTLYIYLLALKKKIQPCIYLSLESFILEPFWCIIFIYLFYSSYFFLGGGGGGGGSHTCLFFTSVYNYYY